MGKFGVGSNPPYICGVYLLHMKYSIDREKLNKVFSKFLESTYKDIRIDENGDLVSGVDTGNIADTTYLALRGRQKEKDGYVLSVPAWSKAIRPLSNTFGDMWLELLSDYVKNNSHEYPISKIVMED